MREFLFFVRRFFQLLFYVRGVFLALALVLVGCAVLFAWSEDMGIGEALYFTLITSLTIGYGDITPTTALGRVVSVLEGVLGVVFVGLVVAVANRALRDTSAEEKALEGREPNV